MAPIEIVLVLLDGRAFGIPTPSVREVVQVVAIAPLPKAASTVEGAIAFRGDIVTVIDIRVRLGLPPKPVELTDHLVILRSPSGGSVAIRVDAAVDLVRLEASDAMRVVSAASGGGDIAHQVARVGDNLVLIYGVESLLENMGTSATGPSAWGQSDP